MSEYKDCNIRESKLCDGKCGKVEFNCYPKGVGCKNCKIEVCNDFEKDISKNRWVKCNPVGKPYFVLNLRNLLLYCDDNIELDKLKRLKHVQDNLVHVFGKRIYKSCGNKIQKFITFASEEEANYGFSPIEFSLCRFEREFTSSEKDWWLTLCVSFDLRNYIEDLIEERK